MTEISKTAEASLTLFYCWHFLAFY